MLQKGVNMNQHEENLRVLLDKIRAAAEYGVRWLELDEKEKYLVYHLADRGLVQVVCVPDTGEAVFLYRHGACSIPEENAVQERGKGNECGYRPADIFLAVVTAINLVVLLCQLALVG